MIWISVAVLQFYNVPILPVRRFGNVRQVPIADMPASFEQFVGASDKGKPQAAGTAPQEDNYIAVIASPSRSHNQAAVVEARERRDTAVDLAHVT
ncbi:MAG: hypothetical protein WA699_07095 [Pseudolabrys sp.]